MRNPVRQFPIQIGAVGWASSRELRNAPGGHLSLREDGLWMDAWAVEPSRLERDLVRLAFAIYSADRIVLRKSPRSFLSPVRQIDLTVEVGDADFWREQLPLVKQALAALCDDVWDITFVQGPPIQRQLSWSPGNPPIVCQYSGGLDSVAGAIIRAADVSQPMGMVTAVHQTQQAARTRRQVEKIGERFARKISSCSGRTTFGKLMRDIHPRFDYQESTQRCRAFLFMACGGAVASALGAGEVEVLENGVGAVNLPPMAGMSFGSRSTRGCHPQFLRTMSRLVAKIAGRPVEYVLPFATWTKAEMVRRALEYDLVEVLQDSMSCVHPLRVRGRAKHCGLCPGCIERRHAFLSAGSDVDRGQYLEDIFDPKISVARGKLDVPRC